MLHKRFAQVEGTNARAVAMIQLTLQQNDATGVRRGREIPAAQGNMVIAAGELHVFVFQAVLRRMVIDRHALDQGHLVGDPGGDADDSQQNQPHQPPNDEEEQQPGHSLMPYQGGTWFYAPGPARLCRRRSNQSSSRFSSSSSNGPRRLFATPIACSTSSQAM